MMQGLAGLFLSMMLLLTSNSSGSTQIPGEQDFEMHFTRFASVKAAVLSEAEPLTQLQQAYGSLYKGNKNGFEIHSQYNATVVKQYREPIQRILEKSKGIPHTPFALIVPQIDARLNRQEIPGLTQSLIVLEQHLQKNDRDPETGISVAQFLGYAWELACLLDIICYHEKNTPQKEERHIRSAYFCFMLAQNLTESGSCFGGYAGRIFHNTVQLLLEIYQHEYIKNEEKN